jgi:phage terminase large subunit GpA-like protein
MSRKVNPLLAGFVRAMRPADRRPVWQWCEDHLMVDSTSPFPGMWRSERSPWSRDVMDAWQKCRRVVVMCSAQSAKTQTAFGPLTWSISEDPGPTMWVMAARDEAGDFLRDRVMPTVMHCQPVAELFSRREGMTLLFQTCQVYFTGSHSPSKLQSKPIRYLFLDEIRNYPPGALALVLKRTRTFWNAREMLLSTPDVSGDDIDREYQAGDCRKWFVECPNCGKDFTLLFENFYWAETEATRKDGVWIFPELEKTLRLRCPHCKHLMADTPETRRWIYRKGRFVATNPNAPSDRASFHWNAMLPLWVSWKSILEEYLLALQCVEAEIPDYAPLKKFYNETLGIPWEEALGQVVDFGFLEERRRDYGFGEEWPEEKARFMAADKQARGGEHYYWIIRAFGAKGASRLIAYGRCHTYAELESIRKEYKVPLANAVIDSGFRASEVYHWCLQSQWKPFKGDNVAHFPHRIMTADGAVKTVLRLWAKVDVDTNIGASVRHPTTLSGRRITLYRYASDTAKDFLAECYRGMVGDWTIPKAAGDDYLKQLTAERRVAVQDSRGRTHWQWRQFRPDNHYLDCEVMVLVSAVINNLLPSGVIRKPSTVHPGGSAATQADAAV